MSTPTTTVAGTGTDQPAPLSDFGTGLEGGAVEAIKRGYRTIRAAVLDCLRDGDEYANSLVIESVSPILEALTGRTREGIIQSCLKRLEADGTIQHKMVGGQQITVVKAK